MYKRILVPVDGSATSAKGLGEAIRLAKLTGASLELVNVVDGMSLALGVEAYATYSQDVLAALRDGAREILDNAQARAASAGVGADTKAIETFGARVADLIVDEAVAAKADLIVIGTHGRRGIGRWLLGSDAEQILRLAPVPVLLVRGGEAESTPASKA
jgi:nucleotide-binding universal stress UspA family protein